MSTQERLKLLQGTLDLLILRILASGAQHGQGIARAIEERAQGVLIVDHGSLYPALQRLEDGRLISAEWGVSANNRQARFYTLTKAGRARLAQETSQWERMTQAIALVLAPDGSAQ